MLLSGRQRKVWLLKIWRKKIYFCWGKEKQGRKRRKLFSFGEEEKGVKYLEKEILLLAEKEEKRHRDRSVPVGPKKNHPISGKEWPWRLFFNSLYKNHQNKFKTNFKFTCDTSCVLFWASCSYPEAKPFFGFAWIFLVAQYSLENLRLRARAHWEKVMSHISRHSRGTFLANSHWAGMSRSWKRDGDGDRRVWARIQFLEQSG